jgi:uncharacterized protein (TIGR02266 family)
MADDRRSAPRAGLSGIRATFEGADGDPQIAEVTNLGTGGLFLRTSSPCAVGKRVSLELIVAGESAPWSALGRIVWARAVDEGFGRPAGMGVKLIDVDDAVLASIEQLVAMREPTEPGVGLAPRPPAVREPLDRTILGVGLPLRELEALGAPAQAPVPSSDPEPEARLATARDEVPGEFGVDTTPDASLAIELVAKKPDSPRPLARVEDELPALPRHRLGFGCFATALAVVAVLSGAAYTFRGWLPLLWNDAKGTVTRGIDRLR